VLRMDSLDARLLHELDADCRVGVLELSRRLSVARATVQSRLDKLTESGVIRRFRPELDIEALGYAVTAFVSLEISQSHDAEVIEHLSSIAEVLEVHTITGQGDLLCRVVARSNADLQDVIDRLVKPAAILRSASTIALSTRMEYRVIQLVDRLGAARPRPAAVKG
jgi:DNA-binding Lrp family transcriptional regulator